MSRRDDTDTFGSRKSFRTTQWTLVRTARDPQALEKLITLYWKPLYFFIRRRGHDNETSKDIVQAFLASMLQRDALFRADPSRGRFRTFLLAALENFLKDRAKASGRQKRGSGGRVWTLDFARGEKEYLQIASGDETPEEVLNRAWARSLLEQAWGAFEGDPAHLKAFRLYRDGADYKRIAAETGLTQGAAKTAVHRLKGQLRDRVTALILQTVSSAEDLEAELAEFLALL